MLLHNVAWLKIVFIWRNALCLWLLLGFAMDLSANQHLRIGVLNLNEHNLHTNKQWQVTRAYLDQKLPNHQILIVPLDLKTVDLVIQQQQMDFLITDAGQFARLKRQYPNQISALATRVLHYKQQASPYVHSVIFTREQSEVNYFSDIAGQRFASLSPNAFADYHIAIDTFEKQGVNINKDFSHILNFNISPLDLVEKVIHKKVDIASLSSHHFAMVLDSGKFSPKALKVLQTDNRAETANHDTYSSEAYPDYVFLALNHGDKHLTQSLRQHLIKMPVSRGGFANGYHISWQTAVDYNKVKPLQKYQAFKSPYVKKNQFKLYLLWSLFIAGIISITILLVSHQVYSYTTRFLIIPITILMVLSLSLLLGWLAEKWSNNFHTHQIQIAKAAAQGASSSISRHVEQIYSRLSILIAEEEDLLKELLMFPNDIENNYILKQLINKRFNNVIAFSLMDKKNTVISSRDQNKISTYCQQNIKNFSLKVEQYGYNQLLVHGNHKNNYHFDVMLRIKMSNGQEAIFFMSLKLAYINDALLGLELPGHSLLLVPHEHQYQIDLSSHGVRYSSKYGSILTHDDMHRLLYDTAVQNTGWQLLAIADADLFSDYSHNLWQKIGLIYFVLLIILTVFLWGLLREEKKRLQAQTELRNMYDSLEMDVIARTHSLTRLNQQLREQISERRQIERNLHINQERLKFALAGSNDGLWDWNIRNGQIYFSPRWQEMLGYPQGTLRGHIDTWKALLHPDDKAMVLERLQQHLRAETDFYEAEHRIAHQQGHYVWVLTRGKVMERDENKQPLRAVGTQIDLTERKQAQTALFEEKERAQVTLHSIADGVISTDAKGRVEYLNPIAEKMTAWSLTEAKDKNLTEVFQIYQEKNRIPAADPVARCLNQGYSREKAKDSLLINRNGKEYAIEESSAPIYGRHGEILGVVLVFHDVSQARQQAKKIAYQASHDLLTGLVNRGEFEKRLKQALQQSKQHAQTHALCYIDLDKFKQVNDTAGHYAGDHILKSLTQLLLAEISQQDTLGRLGGDEFALLLSNCSITQASDRAEKLVSKIGKHPFIYQNQPFELGLSIGLVAIDQDSLDFKSVINQADKACYAAKSQGRGRLVLWKQLA